MTDPVGKAHGYHFREVVMNRSSSLGLAVVAVIASLTGSAMAQQAQPTMQKYLSRAVITPEGIRNFQKQKPTALKAGIAKFA